MIEMDLLRNLAETDKKLGLFEIENHEIDFFKLFYNKVHNTYYPRTRRIPLVRNSSKPHYVEFHYNGIPQNRAM